MQAILLLFVVFSISQPTLAKTCLPYEINAITPAERSDIITLVLLTDTLNPATVDQRIGINIASRHPAGTQYFYVVDSLPVGWATAPTFGEAPFTNASMFDWIGFPQISRFGNTPYVNTSVSNAGIDLNETHIFNDTYWSGRFHASYDFSAPEVWLNITLCGNSTAELLSECQPLWNTWSFTCLFNGAAWHPLNGARVFAPSSLSTANELTFSHPTTAIDNAAVTDPLTLWSDSAPTFSNLEVLRMRAGAGDGNVTVGCSVPLSSLRGRAGRDVLNAKSEPMMLKFSETLQTAIGGPVWSYPVGLAGLSTSAYTTAGGGVSGELTIEELQSNFLSLHDDFIFGENVDFMRILHALDLPNSGIVITKPSFGMSATMDGMTGAYALQYWRFTRSRETSSSAFVFSFLYSKHFWTVSDLEPFRTLDPTNSEVDELMTPVLAATVTAAGFSDSELCAGTLDPLAEPTGLDDSVEPTLDYPVGFYTYKHPFFSTGTRLLNFEACAWDQSGDATYVCTLQFDVHRASHIADVRTDQSSVVDLQSALSGYFKLEILNVTVLNGTYVDTHDDITYERAQPVWMRFKGRTPGTNTVPSDGIAYPSTLEFESAEGNDMAFEIFFCEYPDECTGNSTLASQNANDLIKWYAPTVNGDIDFTDNLDNQVIGKVAVYSSMHQYNTRADSKPGQFDVVLDTDSGTDPVTHDVFVVVRSPAQPDLTVVREWGGSTDTIVGLPTLLETIFAPMPTLSPLFFCYDFLLPYAPSVNFTKFETPSHTRLRGQWTAPEDGLVKIGTITIDPDSRAFTLSLDSTASCAMAELNAEDTTVVTGSFPRRMSSSTGDLVGTWSATTAPSEIGWQRSGVVAYELLEKFPAASSLLSESIEQYARITFTSFLEQGSDTLSASASTDFFISTRVYSPETTPTKNKNEIVVWVVAVVVVLFVVAAASVLALRHHTAARRTESYSFGRTE